MFTFGHPNKRINEISRAARVTCAHARYVMYLFVGGVMMMMIWRVGGRGQQRKHKPESERETQLNVKSSRIRSSSDSLSRWFLELIRWSCLRCFWVSWPQVSLLFTRLHCEKANNTRTLWLWRFISGNRCKCHLCAFVSITWPTVDTKNAVLYKCTNIERLINMYKKK